MNNKIEFIPHYIVEVWDLIKATGPFDTLDEAKIKAEMIRESFSVCLNIYPEVRIREIFAPKDNL